MSLDVTLKDPTATYKTEDLYWANITHNLGKMASEAGLYKALWRPYQLNKNYNVVEKDYEAEFAFEEANPVYAKDIIEAVKKGLNELKRRPEHYKTFNSPNGWGMYEHFVPFVEKYLEALKEFPDAIVETHR